MRFFHALTVRSTDQKCLLSRRDASNAQEITQPSILHAERNPRTLNMCEGNHPANSKGYMVYKD